MRNIADCSAPRRAAGKSWVRGAVVAQLATNTLWMAPRAYRRKAAAADGSEEEEDTRWRSSLCKMGYMQYEEEMEAWQRAAELRHRVRELLSEAARAECSDDEFGDEDEDDEYGFDEDDDGQDEEDFNVDEHSAHDL